MTTPSKIQDSFVIIAAAGTRQQLVTQTTPCGKVTLFADDNNKGPISFGGATVLAATGSTRSGAPLLPAASVPIEIDDLSKIWIDGQNTGDKILFTWTF